MKRFFLFFFILTLPSCSEEVIKKPDNLITEAEMTDMLYDMALFNSIKTTNPSLLTKNNLPSSTDYIFKKYNIDSLQYVTSNQYYASIPQKYQAMHKAVEVRFEEAQEKAKEAREKRTDSIQKANEKRRDSLKKVMTPDALPDKVGNKK